MNCNTTPTVTVTGACSHRHSRFIRTANRKLSHSNADHMGWSEHDPGNQTRGYMTMESSQDGHVASRIAGDC